VRGASRRPRAPRRAGATPLDILYEDRVLLVINKPAGLLSVPLPKKSAEPSVYDQLERYLRPQRRRPFVVHRIDRDTSGLVVFAKDPRTQQALKKQFIHRDPERIYLALVYGHPQPSEGTWRDHLVWDRKALIQKRTHPRDPQGAEASCSYAIVEGFRDASLLEVRLDTGKRNQIRIQARLRGHMLVGERRYVFGPEGLRPIPFARQALHAQRLEFRHPVDGRELQFESPLPDDFLQLLQHLPRPAQTESS
jgi:23S rRNA pseudouridine1911/1915/1917 synthase